jgi:hypothetical protein
MVGAFLALAVACGGGPTSPPPPPPAANTPPVIDAIAVSDTRIEVGMPVTLTATVHDLETPVDRLEFGWSADAGTIAGAGPTATYRAADESTSPVDRTATLVVTERYTSGGLMLENRVTKTLTLHVNNSPKELASLSLRFLNNFGDSSISPEACVAEFAASCSGGKADELQDIRDNRRDFRILSASFTPTSTAISDDRLRATVHTFGVVVAMIVQRPPDCVPERPGDCDPGHVGEARGDFWTTDVYENGRWWMCQSHYTPAGSLSPAARAFVGRGLR